MKFNIWTMNVYPLFNTHTTPHSIKFKFTGCTKNMCAINSFIFFQIIWFLLSVIFKEPNDNKKLRSKSSLNFFLTPLQSYNVTSWLFFIHLPYSKYPSIKTLFYVFCETRNPKLFLDWNKLIKILKLGLWLTT